MLRCHIIESIKTNNNFKAKKVNKIIKIKLR